MSSLEDMLKGYEIPEVVKIRTIFDRTRLENPEEMKNFSVWSAGNPASASISVAFSGSY